MRLDHPFNPDNFLPARIFLFVTAMLSCALVWYGAAGLRGTDQYWYVADVLTLSHGLEPLTNNFFPGPMLRHGSVPDTNYFMHNSPVMLVVGWMAKYISAYHAWILINMLCHIIVGVCVYIIATHVASKISALVVTGIYLISPIAIWQTINPLLEMYYSSLVGLQLLCFYLREKLICRYMLYVFLLVGLLSHPIFIVPACLWGFWALVERRGANFAFELFLFLPYFFLILFFLKYKTVWFPSSFQPELKAIIASAVPGNSNMFWHYSEVLPSIDLALMKDKAIHALRSHFLVAKFAPLYVFTNIALVTVLYLCFFHLAKWWKILFPLGLFGCQYLAMIFLQQNHPRFQQIVAAVVFTVIAIGITEVFSNRNISTRFVSAGVAFGSVLILLSSLLVVHTGRVQSQNEKEEVNQLADALNMVPHDARIVGIDVKPHNPFSFIVRPRQMLFIRTDMLDEQQIRRAIDMFNPGFFVARAGSYPVQGKLLAKLDTGRFGELLVYEYE